MSRKNFFNQETSNNIGTHCRDGEGFCPFSEVIGKNNYLPFSGSRREKWSHGIDGHPFKRRFHRYREKGCFVPVAGSLAHRTICARAAPMLDVAEHLPPVISVAQLFVGLGSTEMCCSRVVMAPGRNFVAHSGRYDQLLDCRWPAVCRGCPQMKQEAVRT